MNTTAIIKLLEAEVGPLWQHFKKPSFSKLYDKLPEEVQKRAQVVFKTLKADPTQTDLKPLHQVKGVYRISLTSGPAAYRAAARRIGNELHWYFIGSHSAYERDVLGQR